MLFDLSVALTWWIFYFTALSIKQQMEKVSREKRLLEEPFMIEFCGKEIARNHKLFDVLNLKAEATCWNYETLLLKAGEASWSKLLQEAKTYNERMPRKYLPEDEPGRRPSDDPVAPGSWFRSLARFSFTCISWLRGWRIKDWIEHKAVKLIFETFYEQMRSIARSN